jgi:hypothetical protein
MRKQRERSMRRIVVALALLGGLGLPQVAVAQSATTLGAGSGAVAGALVGGPIGAVAGAVIGGVIGHSSERGGRRHILRTRRYVAGRRVSPRRAAIPAPRAAPTATAWKDPH